MLVIQWIQTIYEKDLPFPIELPWYRSCQSIDCVWAGLFADSVLFIYLAVSQYYTISIIELLE